jgi:hypothetical protein
MVIQQRARAHLSIAYDGPLRSSAIVNLSLRLHTAQAPVRVQTLGRKQQLKASMTALRARGELDVSTTSPHWRTYKSKSPDTTRSLLKVDRGGNPLTLPRRSSTP